jgi:uncharacterized delta-60 repeat protein
MLFDLEDYRAWGITGVARKSVENVYWGDSYTTWRATHDAYRKAVNEWFLASDVMASAEDKHQLMVNYISIMEKFTDSGRKGKIFFNALCSKSIPGEIVSANGITEGTTLRIFSVHPSSSYYNSFIDLPNLEYPSMWGESKYVLFIGEDLPNDISVDSFVYTTMTQAIYDNHKNVLVGLQSKIKETYILAEGISDIPEWIEPEVPAWYESAELSGYVRDSRSLPISGATVRLVDADGVNHDLVTNDLGYYQFTKEYIYNNISLGTASSAEFDMFVIEETISGTVLYSQTSIYQNSFFGALNDRGISWPVLVKSGKQNRRNFKIEFIPDYSAYPSLSGTILNQDGNPVQNALVELKYYSGQISEYVNEEVENNWVNIGWKYDKLQSNTPKWSKSTKYTIFGEEKSLLTDENGYYEYPSQLIGEWYNNSLKKMWTDLGVDTEWSASQGPAYDSRFAKNGLHVDNDYVTGNGFCWNGQAQGSYVYASGVQSDGKVIAGGDISYYNDVDLGYTIPETVGLTDAYGYSSMIRLNTDGTLDESFETTLRNYRINGSQVFDNPYIQHIKILSDDKILVAGNFNKAAGEHANGLVLLNADGTLDTIFEVPRSNTELQTDSYFSIEYYMTDTMLWADKLSDGRFIAYTMNNANIDMLYVFNADGTLDTNFSFNFSFGGVIETPNYGSSTSWGQSRIINGVLPFVGGFILYGDFYITVDNELFATNIVKINNDGTLDTSFKCIVGSSYGFDMQNYIDTHNNADLDILYFYITSGSVIDVVKTSNATLLLSGNFGYTKVYTNGVGTDTKVRNLIRIDMDGNLLNKFDNAPDPSSDYENDGDAEMGIPVNGKIQIIDTLNSYPGSMNYYSDNGKKLIIHNKFGSCLWTLDLTTGVSEQTGIIFGNTINTSILTLDNKLVIFGDFRGYLEEFENGTGVDGFGERYRYDRFGIVRFEYGPYNHVKEILMPVTVDISSIENPYNKTSKTFSINDIKVFLNPWTQNPTTGEVYDIWDKNSDVPQPEKIYDYQDWFNSRFAYALNERDEQYSIRLEGGVDKDVTLDIHEVLVDAEHGAERVYFDMVDKPTSLSENGFSTDISLNIQTKNSSGDLVNRFRIVFDNGQKELINSQNYNFNYNFNSNWSSFYIYSCNEFGGAEGNISQISITAPITSLDLNELSNLEYLHCSNTLLTSLDLSESNSKNKLDVISIYSAGLTELNMSGFNNLSSLDLNTSSECKILGIDECDINTLCINSQTGSKIYTSKVPVIGNSLSYNNSLMACEFDSTYKKYSFGWPNESGTGDILPTGDGGFIMLNDSTTINKYIPGMGEVPLANGSYMPILKFDSNFDIDVNFSTKFSWFDQYRNWQNSDGSITTVSTHLDGSLLVALRGNSGNGNTLWKESYKGLIIKVDEGTGNANSTFSNNVKIAINPDQSATIQKMHVCVDGKILVVGDLGTEDYNGQSYNKKLIRLNHNGSLDTTFSFYTDTEINGFEVLDDESILVFTSGTMYNTKHLKQDVGVDYGRIVKISSNGTIDTVFSNNINDAISDGNVDKLGVSDTGKILVYGVLGLNNFTSTSDIVYGNTNVWGAYMFNSDGTIDDVWINNLLSLTGYTAGDSTQFPSSASEWPRRGTSILFHNGYFFIPTYQHSGLFKSDNQTGQQGYGLMISSDATSMSYINTNVSGGWISDIKVVSGKIVSIMSNSNSKYIVQNITPKYKYTFDLPGINISSNSNTNWNLNNFPKVDTLTLKRPFIQTPYEDYINLNNINIPYCDELIIKSGFICGEINSYSFDSACLESFRSGLMVNIDTKSLIKSDNSFVYNVQLKQPELLASFKEASLLEIYSNNDNIACDIDLTGFNNIKSISINHTAIRNSVIPQIVSDSLKDVMLYYSKGYENNGQYFVDFVEKLNPDSLYIWYSYSGQVDLLPYKQEFENAINSMSNLKSLGISNLWRSGNSNEVINIENDSIERFVTENSMIQLTSDKIRMVFSYNQGYNYEYTSLKIIGGSYWLTNNVPQSDRIQSDFKDPVTGNHVPSFRSYGYVPDVTGWISLSKIAANYARFDQNHVNFSGLENLRFIGIYYLRVDANSSSANIPWTYSPFTSTNVKRVYLMGEGIAIPSLLNNSILQNLIDVGTTSGVYDLHNSFDLTGSETLRQTLIGRSWTFRIW